MIDSELNYSGSNNINGWGWLFETGILKPVHISGLKIRFHFQYRGR